MFNFGTMVKKRLDQAKALNACKGCAEKSAEIEQLKEENKRLRVELERRNGVLEVTPPTPENSIPIGAHTPSGQLPSFKKTGKKKRDGPGARGGARKGHKGAGRGRFSREDADEIIPVPAPTHCPDCNSELVGHGSCERSVIDMPERSVIRVLYECERKRCPCCGTTHTGDIPVLPKTLYGNSLVAQAATQHYVHGVPLGRVCAILGDNVQLGALLAIFHRIAGMLEPLMDVLIQQYRKSLVKHADETSWSTDGQSGWVWIFCTPMTTILLCEQTRSATVPAKVLGTKRLPGVLVVDRFKGYNKVPCAIQYCFAHLLREVEKLEKDFPDDKEVTVFVSTMAPLLSAAMHLQGQDLPPQTYKKHAAAIATKIKAAVAQPATHLGIQDIQRIFRDNQLRLYHWVSNSMVPAHNNRAERDIRRSVIARKVTFGSQSDAGAYTRSVLSSILMTVTKRLPNSSPEQWLKQLLDNISKKSDFNVLRALPKIKPP